MQTGSVNTVALEFPFTDENLNDQIFYMEYYLIFCVQPLLRCANAAVYSLGPDISEIIIIWLRVRLIDCILKLE